MKNNIIYKKFECVNRLLQIGEDFYNNHSEGTYLPFHTWQHAYYVYICTVKPAFQYQLKQEETISLFSAALLHDLGLLFDYDNHEEKSAEIAESIMLESGFSTELIEPTKELILSTKIDAPKNTVSAKILHDANFDYLSSPDFIAMSLRLRREWNYNKEYEFTSVESWIAFQLEFMRSFKYMCLSRIRSQLKGLSWNTKKLADLLDNYDLKAAEE